MIPRDTDDEIAEPGSASRIGAVGVTVRDQTDRRRPRHRGGGRPCERVIIRLPDGSLAWADEVQR